MDAMIEVVRLSRLSSCLFESARSIVLVDELTVKLIGGTRIEGTGSSHGCKLEVVAGKLGKIGFPEIVVESATARAIGVAKDEISLVGIDCKVKEAR